MPMRLIRHTLDGASELRAVGRHRIRHQKAVLLGNGMISCEALPGYHEQNAATVPVPSGLTV